jgi:hypothetical protein
MNVLTSVLSAVPVEAIDPKVTANDKAPWMGVLRDIAGGVLTTCIVLIVIILVIGVSMAVGGKLAGMASAQSTGFMILVWGFVGAAVIGSIGGLVLWATTNSLAPAPAAVALGVLVGVSG